MGAARTRGRMEKDTKGGWWGGGRWRRMYGVEEGGAGTIQGREKRERGQSQSDESEGSGETDDSDGEDETGRGRQTKKVCMEGWRGRGREGSDSDSEEEMGVWLKREMDELEERGGGRLMGREEERKLFWEGGGEAHRKRREREWEMYGWEEWEVLETNPDHTGPGFPQEHLGGPVGEGEGASTAMGEGGDGAAEILGECERRGRTRDDGGSERVIEGNGGKEMDGGGRGGSKQRVKLTEGRPGSKRKPLRGRRRGGAKVYQKRMIKGWP